MKFQLCYIVLLLALPGCKLSFDSSGKQKPPAPNPDPIAACWAPTTKTQAITVAEQTLSTVFGKTIPSGVSPTDAKAITDSFQVKLSDFFTFSYDKDSRSLHCGADLVYSFNDVPDHETSTIETGEILPFELYQGENGMSVLIREDDTSGLDVSYSTATSPPPQ